MFERINPLSVSKDLTPIIVTLLLAFASGTFFKWLAIPAPYLLGSLIGVWFVGSSNKLIGAKLGIPRWFQVSVILGLGTLIGGNFNADTFKQILNWLPSVAAMFIATILATLIGIIFLIKQRQYDFNLALLCCIPGGQAEITLISREFVKKDHIVALFHLVRVTMVLCFIPIILSIYSGGAAIKTSENILITMPSLMELDALSLLTFIMISLLSLPIAKFVHLPMPYLLGPLMISASLHLFGLLAIPRISEFIILAQITVGSILGIKLASIRISEITKYLQDAVTSIILILSTYLVVGLLTAYFANTNFLEMFLAFAPG